MTLPGSRRAISIAEKIPSQMADADVLCLKIRNLLQSSGHSPACFAVELLARECLANAINHGNKKHSDKSVSLRLSVGPVWIRLEVVDEGLGFPWRKASRDNTSLTACSGRGLGLYALYAGRVRFNNAGNKITLWVSSKN
jgi:anti-sigma regulatory factor (Ser/Thr protein kinase)